MVPFNSRTAGLAILIAALVGVFPGRAAETNRTAAAKLADQVQVFTNVIYGVAGGTNLLLDVYLPPPRVGRPLPVLMLIHGGGWEAGSRAAPHFIFMGKLLALQGYAVFSVDYRLVQRPKDGKPAVNAYPAPVDDCQRAVRWVRHNAQKYGIDPQRVAALGDSAGGHLVSLLGTTDTLHNDDKTLAAYSSRVNAVINLYGPADLTREFPTFDLFGITVQGLVDNLVGKGNREQQKAASPLFHLDEKTVPFLLVQGTEDKLVPVEMMRDFNEALKKGGHDVTYLEFPGEGHGIGQPPNQKIFHQKLLAFLARTLK